MTGPLDELVETWLELATAMTMRDLEADVPRASLGRGAAGIAFVLGRIGRARNDPAVVAASRRWLGTARRAARRRDGFRPRKWPASTHSVMFGANGLAAVAALVTPTAQNVADYVAITRRRIARAPAEYNFGVAGNVFAASAVARATGAVTLTELVRDLGVRLAALAPLPPGGFAHGDVGVLAARLVAAHACGEPMDPAVVAALATIEPARALAIGAFARSWCNGLAGYALAWVLAAELAGDDRCRARALAAAPHLLAELDECGGSLCCGLGGRAYALLAIARLDPGGPWREHAIALATRAVGHELSAGGMIQGLPGVVALAHDLRAPAAARFPFVEVV